MIRPLFSIFCALGAVILGGLVCVAPLAALYALLIVPLTAYGLHLRHVSKGQPRPSQDREQ